ncbi:MAG TPA: Fic family protein [Steroidobacteraceae bacterium]|nr:Fic family protein [Steroidobacteraceae bacterium]
MPDWIGYRWLIERFGLTVTQALRTETLIGSTRATVSDGTTERRTVQQQLRPEPTLAGHLSFALKHEGVHLEALSRLFAVGPAAELEDWIRREPTGRYARRTGFLYECLTRQRLDVPDTTRGNYVPVVDSELELVASTPINNIRWRVRDNLLGSAGFSPQVHLTPDVARALDFDVREHIARLEGQFSPELVRRSAVWLTIKESRASFEIEHEENKRDRIQRFAAVMEQRTGQSADPFSPADLEALQREILGPNALHYGLRRSPVFVGETARVGEERVHYIGPHWNDVPSFLEGLRELLRRTAGVSSVARAALASFGFVYLHPMIDGNGRISRFLINDVLRRDGALPAPYVVPISAILQKPDLRPLSYDGALELFSRPLMQQYRGNWSFGPEQLGDDGVTYNLQFDRYQDALHAWRYPDLTRQVTFLAAALDLTIEQEMRAEAQYLQRHGAARARLKSIVEGPDPTLDRIIRSVRESRGTISGKLRAEYPMLERAEIADDVVRAIREEFPWTATSEG